MAPLPVSSMNAAARSVWARTELHVWPERYRLVSLPLAVAADAAQLLARSAGTFAALVVERDEVSLTIEDGAWRAAALPSRADAGPYRAITLDIDIDLGVIGYFAPAAERLAAAGVSIVPQCAFLKDHLLVREADCETALRVLDSLAAEARA